MAAAIVKRRVIIGWRAELINAVLDACSNVPYGRYLHIEVDLRLKPDSLGRLQRKFQSSAEKQRFYKVENRERYLSSKQRDRDRMLVDYDLYCKQYFEIFPDSQPVSYRVFSKLGLSTKWRSDPYKAVLSSYRIPSEISASSKSRNTSKK